MEERRQRRLQPPASVDNITIDQLACPQPTSLTVSNLTAYTAVFDWTPAGTETSWEVFARKAGDTITATVSSHPYTFTGLTQHSTYTFGVKALCSATDESFVSTTTAQTLYSCPAPTALGVTNSTLNSLTVSWTAGGNEQGWYVACDGDTNYTAQNPYTITGLASSTNYSISVWGDCGPNDGQSLVATTSGATTCAMVTDFPWSDDFESYTANSSGAQANNLPVCWSRWTGCTGSSYTGYPNIMSSATYAHSGTNAVRFYTQYSTSTTTTYTDQIAILPEMQNLSGKMVSFWAACGSSSYTSTSKLAVGVYEGNDTYVWLDTVSANSTTPQYFELPLNAYTGQGNRIAICGIKPGSSYCNIYLDDITVDEIPSCMHPSNLVLTNATASTLTISWTAGGNENSWQVTCGNDTYTATTNSYTLTGLDANTGYEVSVAALCSATDVSEPISATFRTECAANQPLPYSENFNAYVGTTYNTAGPAPSCWTIYSNATTPANAPHVRASGSYYYSPDATPSMGFVSGGASYGDTNMAILPGFATPVSQLQLSFWYQMESTSYGSLHVGVMDGGQFVDLQTIPSTTTGTTATVTFANAPATATHIALLWYHNNSYYSCCIDDLEVIAVNQGGEDTTVVTPSGCAWASNIAAGESATSTIGGFVDDYGIDTYAERIANTGLVTIDSIGYMMYEIDDNPGSITFSIYNEENGLPGSSFGSVTVNSWTHFTREQVALPTPVTMNGNYYIVATISDDATAMLATSNRTQATSTAYVYFGGNWRPLYQVLSTGDNNDPFYGSFFLDAHACATEATETYMVTVAANDAARGTVTGGGEYGAYGTATLTATPNAGYYFSQWNDGVTANPRTITVLSDTAFTAIFEALPSCEYTLPYTCGFENDVEMLCWNTVNGDLDNYNWFRGEATNYAHTGSHYMQSDSYSQTAGSLDPNNWLISPELTIPAEGATLSWFVRGYNSIYYAENYKVLLSSTGSTDTLSFTTQLFDGTVASAAWTEMTAQITTPGTVRIAFVHADSYDVWALMIDDISVVANQPAAPTCDTVTNLSVNDITSYGADLSWNTTSDSCHLEIRELPNGQWIAPETWGIAIEDVYNFWGLNPETTYEVRVRAICDSVTYSDWVSVTFTTDTVAIPACVTPLFDSIVPGPRSAQIYWSSTSENAFPELEITVLGTPFDEDEWPYNLRNSPYTITGLQPNTTYQVRMRDFCYWDDVNEETVYTDFVFDTFTTTAGNGEIFVPYTGIDTLFGAAACGITIYDCGVEDEYFNNANGTLVLIPANGDTLTMTGDYNIEEGWDYLIVTANGQTDTLTDEGTLTITSTGAILLTFKSDGSTTYDGFEFTTTCSPAISEPDTVYYTVTLLVNDETMGTVSGAGEYAEGTEVEISATANEGYHFVSWSDDNTETVRTLTVTEDITLTANFAEDTTIVEPTYYDITLLAAMVSQVYGDTLFLIENEAQWSGAGHFEEGTTTTLSVTPLGEFAGSAFLGWNDGNTEMPRTITVTEDATYTAYFDRNEGIDGIEMTAIRLYPNPASEQVTVEGYDGRIEVLDMTGRVVISTNSNVIDIRNLASGAYFVKAGQQVKKLIVK